jgi:hypothetical protein
MNVLIDANVVFDVVEKRQPHYAASNQVLCLCRRRVLAGMVAYHTIANVFYQYGKPAVPFLWKASDRSCVPKGTDVRGLYPGQGLRRPCRAIL